MAILFDSQSKKTRILSEFKEEVVCMTPRKVVEGSYLIFDKPTGNKVENWYIEKVTNNFYGLDPDTYTIRNELGMYLDIENMRASNSKKLIMWTKTGADSQIWKIK